MTIEEAKAFLESALPVLSAKMQSAIKALLEQQPILDKVKEEIEQMDFDFGDYFDHTDEIIDMVLAVIDKYKAESED